MRLSAQCTRNSQVQGLPLAVDRCSSRKEIFTSMKSEYSSACQQKPTTESCTKTVTPAHTFKTHFSNTA